MHAALYNLIIHVIEYFCIFLRQHENEKTVFIAKKPLQYFKYVDNKYIILIHLKSNISKWQNSIVHIQFHYNIKLVDILYLILL